MKKLVKKTIFNAKVAKLLVKTIIKWQQDQCLEMGAALAYYVIFSLFPTMLLILSLFSFFLGPDTDVFEQILKLAREGLPSSAFLIIEDALTSMNKRSVGAGIIGFLILFFSASHAFDFLSRAVDKIWQVHKNPQQQKDLITVVITFIKYRIFALIMVLSTSLVFFVLLLVDIVNKIFLNILDQVAAAPDFIQIYEKFFWVKIQTGISFLILLVIIMLSFKILPSTKIKWGDIWLGATLTATALFILQRMVSNSVIVINISKQFQYYGVIGGVMVLLFWIYLTCEIFFLGNEFTYVYTQLFGSRRSQ